MKIKLAKNLTVGILLAVTTVSFSAEKTIDYYLFMWERFCDETVEGGVLMPTPLNRAMRDSCTTNVFVALITNNYDLVISYPPRDCDIPYLQMQGADYKATGSDAFFEVSYVTSLDQNVGGLIGLLYAQSYYSNRGGKIFMQYQDGPGDVCLIDTNADVTNPTTIRDVFFSRDNVAVRVRSRNASNILEFARLLDACILSSPVETLPVTQ